MLIQVFQLLLQIFFLNFLSAEIFSEVVKITTELLYLALALIKPIAQVLNLVHKFIFRGCVSIDFTAQSISDFLELSLVVLKSCNS